MIYYPAFRSIVKQCGDKDDFLAKIKNVDEDNSVIKFIKEQWSLFHFITVMSHDMKSFLELLKTAKMGKEYGDLSLELYAIKCGKYKPSEEASTLLKELKQLQIIDINKKVKPTQ